MQGLKSSILGFNRFLISAYELANHAPTGMHRLIGYDRYDYNEHVIADYDAWDAAHAGLKDKLASLHADNQLTLFIDNDHGDCLAKGSVGDGDAVNAGWHRQFKAPIDYPPQQLVCRVFAS